MANETMMANMINPEVMGDMISAKIEALLKITPYAKVDTTLQGVPGDTKTVPSWNYIGDAEDFNVETVAQTKGYSVLITNHSLSDSSNIKTLVQERKVDGIILPVQCMTDELICLMTANKFPFVVMGEPQLKKEEILAADLGYSSRKGGVIDRFRNRVMFPIIDLQGNVVAFGGRKFTEDATGGKYVNTSDTLIYKKTNHLFAMNIAKNSKTRELILCEGYMDVIALHQAGFSNAVAALGTAVTPQQARVLHKYADRVVLSQDGDEAGQKSIARSIPIMKDEGLDVRVLEITGAKDPDEFIRKYGPERFKMLLDGCSNDIEYSILRIGKQYDIDTDDGRLHYLREVCEYLSGLGTLEREVYAGRIADRLGIEKSAVLSQAEASARRRLRAEKEKEFREMANSTAGVGNKINPDRSSHLRGSNAEYKLLAILFRHQDKLPGTVQKLPPEYFVTEFGRRIYEQFIDINQSGQEIDVTQLTPRFSETEGSEIVRILNSDEASAIGDLDTLIDVITTEHFKPKPQEAANLSEDELLMQMSRLKKLKK